MSLKLDGTGKITGIDQGLNVVGVGTFSSNLNVSGDVVVGGGLTVTGNLNYENVTDVDSIGVITARSGIIGDLTGNVTGDLTGNIIGSPTLSGISSSISDTAVDVFIYDTSKDSDGGAWRKRTQHTSWYNETLNTATRGSRREFPAVAVIVVNQSYVSIYDGDDPDLPLWMKFNQSTIELGAMVGYTSFTIGSAVMVNGILMVGLDASNQGNVAGLRLINFISEHFSWKANNSNRNSSQHWPIVDRNGGRSLGYDDGNYIVNEVINDVAMTVLPSAPIDSATGLPVPTIAVATDGGVSVIKDDGTVVSYTRGGNEYTGSVAFDELDDLIISWGTTAGGYRHVTRITNPFVGSTTLDITYGYIASDTGLGGSAAGNTGGVVTIANSGRHFGIDFDSSSGVPSTQNNYDDRLDFLHINDEDTSKSLVAFATTSYNTGWMHGDIKGAFLSDTDATNVSADTLNSVNTFDGTFATSTGWTTDSDWTISGGVASCSGADAGRFIYPTTDTWPSGSSVVVEVTVTAYTSGTLYVSYTTGAATGGTNMTATGTYKFVNNVSGNDLIYFRSESFIGSIDNVKIYYAEYDRSVNNKGLIPYGTINKSAVATGADLVAYSGFSNSNYLLQPYNSDLNFGTSNFCVMGWFKLASNNTQECIMMLENPTGEIDYLLIEQQSNGDIRMQVDVYNGAAVAYHTTQPTGVWIHYCGLRISDRCQLYINGSRSSELDNGFYFNTSFSFDNTGGSLYIGRRTDGTNPFSGQLALWKISSGLPSPEQIKKIYEDEKVLFQENAACTLYGSSDAVTALAYDEVTDRLHVGTSSGRSDFQGLRRINNTTTAVTTAISAHDEFIAEQ